MNTRTRKVLLTVLTVGIAGALAGLGVFSAFSSTTSNPGNTFAAGSVTIGDNDGDSALFSNAVASEPGDYDRCIKVTYTGTLAATVKLYTSAISADGSKVNVTIHKSAEGAAVPADCTGYVADGAAIYATSTLSVFGTAHSGWANGLASNPGLATKWVADDDVTYRIRLTVPDDNASQGADVSAFTLTWEAQNQ